jgi:hypothetical protein
LSVFIKKAVRFFSDDIQQLLPVWQVVHIFKQEQCLPVKIALLFLLVTGHSCINNIMFLYKTGVLIQKPFAVQVIQEIFSEYNPTAFSRALYRKRTLFIIDYDIGITDIQNLHDFSGLIDWFGKVTAFVHTKTL